MAQSLTRTRPVKPAAARTCLLEVVRTTVVSSGFVRVTLTGADDDFDASFTPMGYDQWLRLFLPTERGLTPVVPVGDADGWYTRLLAMSDEDRPVVRNYTIRRAELVAGRWQVDIDFVVHRSAASGLVEGIAASWALSAQPGDRVGLLDQGVIFNRDDATATTVVVADESGLPGAEGIARSLEPGQRAVFVLELASDDDRRVIDSAGDIHLIWAVRASTDTVGRRALEVLDALQFDAADYVYAVGEASFVLKARSAVQRHGVPKDRVDFCAYWRPERRA